ncbi:transcriptional regulator [Kocuria dechangensis]|uniref:Transcriptional regulator n=1 Tax=Kocuria dechangensis TaxID=1176249 RepID=A0A917H639_9MICC|nr:AraC family transcriptional regulator [Kocuria dechangensis]GGG68700.1 transcriptional regulator [Kocuria dechangensis]
MADALMVAEPLGRFGRLRTTEASVAEDVVSRVYVPHQLSPLDREPLDARLNAVQSGPLTLGYLAYGAASKITLPPTETWIHVSITVAGRTRVYRDGVQCATTTGRGSGTILASHQAQVVECDRDTAQFVLKVSRADLEDHLATLSPCPPVAPLDLGPELNLTHRAGRSLLRTIDLVCAEWDDDGVIATDGNSRRHAEELILTQVLLASSVTHQAMLGGGSQTAGNDVLRRTVEFIHDQAGDLPTLADMTRVAGVSARALQLQFERHLGCTPSEYARGVRLRCARDALLYPGTEETSVTDVATRWGFYHLGRFSALYRQTYGELPSQTLRHALRR